MLARQGRLRTDSNIVSVKDLPWTCSDMSDSLRISMPRFVMRNNFFTPLMLLVFSLSFLLPSQRPFAATYRVADTLEIDTVPSWFPVGFCLLTHGQQQYVAYYNDQHEMVVACRKLEDRKWQQTVLPSKIGWDSHNYVTMAVDAAGYLHLSGNMHCVPLVYFRTEKPGDI